MSGCGAGSGGASVAWAVSAWSACGNSPGAGGPDAVNPSDALNPPDAMNQTDASHPPDAMSQTDGSDSPGAMTIAAAAQACADQPMNTTGTILLRLRLSTGSGLKLPGGRRHEQRDGSVEPMANLRQGPIAVCEPSARRHHRLLQRWRVRRKLHQPVGQRKLQGGQSLHGPRISALLGQRETLRYPNCLAPRSSSVTTETQLTRRVTSSSISSSTAATATPSRSASAQGTTSRMSCSAI